jgi:hypothetical protein
MMRKTIFLTGIFLIVAGYMTSSLVAGPPVTICSRKVQQPPCMQQRQSNAQPRCGVEITCTDKPIQLGYSDGVCFRASCPGIWAVLHQRVDQASFRRRIWTYRHYTFKGYWELKDQGAIQSGPVRLREVFLVLQDDLIEFRLRDPDKYARVELWNLGYIKRGDPCDLKKWLAKQSYLEWPAMIRSAKAQAGRESENCSRRSCTNAGSQWPIRFGAELFCSFRSACRRIGLPF